ncbi:MAG: hypothetical protein P8Q92_08630 [Pseudoprimorskyibacter sp.]|nr:hypothetical protein [Pseudoprimorskyibacter sp.]
MTKQGETLQIVGPKNTFPEVSLIEPAQSGYLMLAIEIDHRPPIGFFLESRRKKNFWTGSRTLRQHWHTVTMS